MAATKMDWQKTMLIAAMAAVVFTLIIRWTDFQESMAPAERLPAAERRAASSSTGQELPEANESGVSELPSVDEQHLDVPQQSQSTSSARTISVHTDTLEVDIDLRGGDLTYLALPQHYAQLDRPDLPFVILNDSEFETYVSQKIGRASCRERV